MEVTAYRNHNKLFNSLSVTVHVVGAVHFWYGCYYDWFWVIVPPEVLPIFSAFGNKLKFLTYWDALLQASFFTICCVSDIVTFTTKTKRKEDQPHLLVKVKDFIMAAFAFPIAMFVGTTFWGLMAIDRELVLPKVLDPYFPSWLNHVMHTNIMIFQLLELTTSPRTYPLKRYGIPALFAFQGAYLSWMYFVHYKSGLWVYPIFNVLNAAQRILFIAGSFATGLVFYYVGDRVNKFLWDNEIRRMRRHVRYMIPADDFDDHCNDT